MDHLSSTSQSNENSITVKKLVPLRDALRIAGHELGEARFRDETLASISEQKKRDLAILLLQRDIGIEGYEISGVRFVVRQSVEQVQLPQEQSVQAQDPTKLTA